MGLLKEMYEMSMTLRGIRKAGITHRLTIADAERLIDLIEKADLLDYKNQLLTKCVTMLSSGMSICEYCEHHDSGTCAEQCTNVCDQWKLRQMNAYEIRDAYMRMNGYDDGAEERRLYSEMNNFGNTGVPAKPPVIYDPDEVKTNDNV